MKVHEFVNLNEDPAGYYVEGHVEPERFLKAVRGYWLATDGTPGPGYDPEDVKQIHLQVVPKDHGDEDGLLFGDEGEPVTVLFD